VVSTQMGRNLMIDEIYLSKSTLLIFIKLDRDFVLMQATEVPSVWLGFKVVHFRFWCISGSITSTGNFFPPSNTWITNFSSK
jgi:hypothetical protein